jgi:hypothetical protein
VGDQAEQAGPVICCVLYLKNSQEPGIALFALFLHEQEVNNLCCFSNKRLPFDNLKALIKLKIELGKVIAVLIIKSRHDALLQQEAVRKQRLLPG